MKNYNDLGFPDNFLFCKILSSNPELCRELLSRILEKDTNKISILSKEVPIEITPDGKGVRLDVYAEDEDTVYDIEMQTIIPNNLAKRTRYYQGMIDLNLLERGADYSELKASYIIFVCLEDPFDKNGAVYTMRNRCDEYNDLYLEDDAIKIFLNASGNLSNVSEGLRNFLEYVATGEAKDDFCKALDIEVSKAKDKEDWRVEYMTLNLIERDAFVRGKDEGLAEGIVEGRSEGIAEGQISTLISLVSKKIISLSDAIKESGLSEAEFLEKIEQSTK